MVVTTFLGQALKFPLRIVNGKVLVADSKDSIMEGIITLLNTEKGSRFFLPEYGSRLHELIFEPNDTVLFPLLRHFIVEAINQWESRIKFNSVEFYQENEVVNCNIECTIVATSESLNFIYPFYRKIEY